MYIVVMFGDKETEVFNPDCRCVSLLSTIRDKCLDEQDMEVDLSDESGNVKNLAEIPDRYATELVRDRQRLVLIRVDRTSDDDLPLYTPLLNDNDFVNDTFLAQLALKSAKSVVTPDIDPKRNVKISRSLSKPKVTTINGGPKTARHVAASTKLRTGKVR